MYPGGIQIDFDWIQYLNLAKELAQSIDDTGRDSKLAQSIDEAKLRTSMSRAYYAAFSNAKYYIEDVDHESVPKEHAHTFVVDYFKGYGPGRKKKSRQRNKIGKDLNRMLNKRVMADYQRKSVNSLRILLSEAEDVLIRSEKVITELGKGGF